MPSLAEYQAAYPNINLDGQPGVYAWGVVEPSGGWAWSGVGGEDAAQEAIERAKGIGGWLLLDGKVIGDYRQKPEAADGLSGVTEAKGDHGAVPTPQGRSQGDCAGTGADPEGAGDAPGADGGVQGAETGQEAIRAAILRVAMNELPTSIVGATQLTAALMPVVQQLIDQARAAGRNEAVAAIGYETSCVGCAQRLDRQYVVDMEVEQRVRAEVAEEIAVAIDAEANYTATMSARPDIRQEDRDALVAECGAFDAAIDIVRNHGKVTP